MKQTSLPQVSDPNEPLPSMKGRLLHGWQVAYGMPSEPTERGAWIVIPFEYFSSVTPETGPGSETPDTGLGWALAARIIVTENNETEIVEFRIHPIGDRESLEAQTSWTADVIPPEGGITSQMLREVRFRELFKLAADLIPNAARDPNFEGTDLGELPTALRNAPERSGRSANRELLQAQAAAEYEKQVTHGRPKPVVAVAETIGYSLHYTRDLLKGARVEGFLTRPAVRGKAGGRLTSKGKAILSAHRSTTS